MGVKVSSMLLGTIPLQYSLAGGQGVVSSNTIIASLSHNTPKSMLGQKLLAI